MCFNYNNCCNRGCNGGCNRGCNGGCNRGCDYGYNGGCNCWRRPPYWPPFPPYGPIIPPTPTPAVPSTITLTATNAAAVPVAANGVIPFNTTSTTTGTALTPTANGVQINEAGTYLINYSVPLTNTTGADATVAANLNVNGIPVNTSSVPNVATDTTATPAGTYVYTVPAGSTLPQTITLTNASTSTADATPVAVSVPATTTVGTAPILNVTKIA